MYGDGVCSHAAHHIVYRTLLRWCHKIVYTLLWYLSSQYLSLVTHIRVSGIVDVYIVYQYYLWGNP